MSRRPSPFSPKGRALSAGEEADHELEHVAIEERVAGDCSGGGIARAQLDAEEQGQGLAREVRVEEGHAAVVPALLCTASSLRVVE